MKTANLLLIGLAGYFLYTKMKPKEELSLPSDYSRIGVPYSYETEVSPLRTLPQKVLSVFKKPKDLTPLQKVKVTEHMGGSTTTQEFNIVYTRPKGEIITGTKIASSGTGISFVKGAVTEMSKGFASKLKRILAGAAS